VPAWALKKILQADISKRDSALRMLLPTVRRRLEGVLPRVAPEALDRSAVVDCIREFGVGAVRLGCTNLGESGVEVSTLLVAFADIPNFVLDDESFAPLSEAVEIIKAHVGEQPSRTLVPLDLRDVLTSAPSGLDPDDLDGTIRAAEEVLEYAQAAAVQIQQDLSVGLVPALADLEWLCTLWVRLEALAFASSGDDSDHSDLPSRRRIDRILEEARSLQGSSGHHRIAVQRLLTIEGPANLGSQLDRVRDLCREASNSATPVDLEGISLLVELIDLANADSEGSFDLLDDLSRRARVALPDDLGTIVIGAVQGKLRLTSPVVAGTPLKGRGSVEPPSETEAALTPHGQQAAAGSNDVDSDDLARQATGIDEHETSSKHDPEPGDGSATSNPLSESPAPDLERVLKDASDDGSQEAIEESDAVPVPVSKSEPTSGTATSRLDEMPTGDRSQAPLSTVTRRDTIHNDNASSAPEQDTIEAPAADLLMQLVASGRWALTHHWATAYGLDGPAAAYAGLAFAAAASSSDGPCAAAFSEATLELNLEALQGHRGAILAVVSGAVRASLLAPLANGPTVIGSLRPAFTGLPSFNALLDAVSRSALRGVDLTAVASTAASIAAADDALAAVVREAQQREISAPTRTLKFARATRVWQAWTAPEGILGALLSVVARNQSERLSETQSQVLHLRGRRALLAAMEETDARLHNGPHRADAIEAGARTRLLDWANDILETVSGWCSTTQEHLLLGQGGSWQQEPLMELRSAVREHGSHVQAELLAWAAEDEMVRLHVESVSPFLEATWRMCDGQIET
jgi:hypothetical protein